MGTSPRHSPEEKTHRTGRIRRLLLYSFLSLFILLLNLQFDGRLNSAWSLSQAEPGGANAYPGVSLTSPNWVQTSSDNLTTSSPVATSARPTSTPSPTITASPSQAQPVVIEIDTPFKSGTIFLSLLEASGRHLFAYNPQTLPFTRLTTGDWEDITPSASPDGTRLAFASNRDGGWDIYILDLLSGAIQQITATPEYDAYPSWSPDGQWLVYETYTSAEVASDSLPESGSGAANNQNLEIFVLQINQPSKPIRLTSHPAADFAPAWSPAGRQIAFVSNRSGEHEIWIADLDRIDDRYQNISRNPAAADKYPTWSPDGNILAWSSTQAGYQNIFFKPLDQPGVKAAMLGTGDRPVWSPVNGALIATVSTPNRTYLSGYIAYSPGMALPSISLPGIPAGITWGSAKLAFPLPEPLRQVAKATIEPAWQTGINQVVGIPAGRQRLVELEDIEAPYPLLSDLVDESFNALRSRLADHIGWDYLASLDNAFIPLTSPLFPGMLSDWLYTGRAFTLNPAPINADWMLVMREDFGSEIYWRVYLRTRYQDGAQGRPLHDPPWNFNARFSGDPRQYEDGGAFSRAIPGGYWYDFTELAASFGWQRLPALVTWRSALPAARFNEYAFTDGLDWQSAMGELYPAEALHTPTPVLPPTHTPTATRWPTRTPTPTRTPWPSRTPSPTASNP